MISIAEAEFMLSKLESRVHLWRGLGEIIWGSEISESSSIHKLSFSFITWFSRLPRKEIEIGIFVLVF